MSDAPGAVADGVSDLHCASASFLPTFNIAVRSVVIIVPEDDVVLSVQVHVYSLLQEFNNVTIAVAISMVRRICFSMLGIYTQITVTF